MLAYSTSSIQNLLSPAQIQQKKKEHPETEPSMIPGRSPSRMSGQRKFLGAIAELLPNTTAEFEEDDSDIAVTFAGGAQNGADASQTQLGHLGRERAESPPVQLFLQLGIREFQRRLFPRLGVSESNISLPMLEHNRQLQRVPHRLRKLRLV